MSVFTKANFTKGLLGAFASANILAAVGSYQTAQEAYAHPLIDDDTAWEIVMRKPVDNLARFSLGDNGEQYTRFVQNAYVQDDAIDASFVRSIGNFFNQTGRQTTYEQNFAAKMLGLFSMAATTPGSYIGGISGSIVPAGDYDFE